MFCSPGRARGDGQSHDALDELECVLRLHAEVRRARERYLLLFDFHNVRIVQNTYHNLRVLLVQYSLFANLIECVYVGAGGCLYESIAVHKIDLGSSTIP